VAGTADYLIFTIFTPRPGWLIYSFIFIFISMKSKIMFNRKSLKFFRPHLKNKSALAAVALKEILKSTTPAAIRLCNALAFFVLRPPLLQKEGKSFSISCI
jgi:hypothetical protein